MEENKQLVRRFIQDVVNTGNVDCLADFVSPEYREANAPADAATGPEAMKQHIIGVRNTFPDLQLTVEQQIAEGEWVVTRITARGTHLGSWLGIAPTGKTVEIGGVNIDRIVDGRIAEHGGAANMFEALLGIGAIRPVS